MELQDELRAVPWPRAPLPTVNYHEVPLDRGGARAGHMPPEPRTEMPTRPIHPRDTSAPEIEVSMTEVSLRALTLLDGSSRLDGETGEADGVSADDPFAEPAAASASTVAPTAVASSAHGPLGTPITTGSHATPAAPKPRVATIAPTAAKRSEAAATEATKATATATALEGAARATATEAAATGKATEAATKGGRGPGVTSAGAARSPGAPRPPVHLPKVQINLPQGAASVPPPQTTAAPEPFEALELRTFVIPPAALDRGASAEQKLELVRKRFASRLPCPIERVRRVDARLLEPGALMLLVWCPVD